jgi:hypothetical protein
MNVLERLNEVGFERSRRAVAALALSVMMSFYLVVALLLLVNGMPEWTPAFVGLAVCYLVAFLGVTAEWFWGRWFAAGLGWSGLIIAVAGLVSAGEGNPVLVAQVALHGLVVGLLAGKKMAARYDEQPAWRERYGMDEYGVARLRKTVTRASASLPSVVIWALAPKQPGEGMLVALATLVGAGLVVVGLQAVVRLRTWGVLALGAATAILAGAGLAGLPPFDALTVLEVSRGASLLTYAPVHSQGALEVPVAFGGLALAAALVPFIGPLARHLRRAA